MAFALAVAFALLLALASPASANQIQTSETPRFTDTFGVVASTEAADLDAKAQFSSEACQLDFPIRITDSLNDLIISEYARWFYTQVGYGYGDDSSGVILVLNASDGELCMVPFGTAVGLFPEFVCDAVLDELIAEVNANGFYAGFDLYLDNVVLLAGLAPGEAEELLASVGALSPADVPSTPATTESVTSPTTSATSTTSTAGKASGTRGASTPVGSKPDWYPESVSSFQHTHNPDADRVVDIAGIFTSSQLDSIRARVQKIIQKTGYDVVVYTDVSTYGDSRELYAADVYWFNGYGLGDDYSGMIWFVSMQRGNRGWVTLGTGSIEHLFTEKSINQIDDILEPYMVDGNYYEGLMKYLDTIDYLLEHGSVPVDLSDASVFATIVGLISAIIGIISKRRKMISVKVATEANSHLKDNEFILTSQSDRYLYSTYVRTKIPKNEGGHSGGSSFSGGFSSHGGGSFSGGGRSF